MRIKPLTEGVSIGIGELWILASLTLGKFTFFHFTYYHHF